LLSAVECTATVLMPISRQARNIRNAISPRLAMTIFSSMLVAQPVLVHLVALALVNNDQRLTEFDRLTILHAD